MKKKRKIAVLTGKRGGFGAMIEMMKEIEADPLLELAIIVTDMHLSKKFGKTVIEVEQWFGKSYRVDLKQKGDSSYERGKALGRAIIGFVDVLKDIQPDILVTLGDRGEVLSACIAASELNIPVAHILGGDVAGNRDGIRIHAITKLAHLHFPSNQDSYNRIIKLGEEPWRVFNYGATYIDKVINGTYTSNIEVRNKFKILPQEDYLICIQHPMTLQELQSYKEARAVYGALKKYGKRTLIIWPCSDQGYEGVLRAMEEFKDVPHFSFHKNIDAVDFWGLMSGASVFVGNSSSGLMETPYFNLPSVSVGRRQEGRVRDKNVLTVEPRVGEILKGLIQATDSKFKPFLKNNYVFGGGDAGKSIVATLKKVPLGDKLLYKKITY